MANKKIKTGAALLLRNIVIISSRFRRGDFSIGQGARRERSQSYVTDEATKSGGKSHRPNREVIIAAFLCFSLSTGYAQEAVTASGGDGVGAGGSVAYSVGQVAYTANSGTTGLVSQGVQQAYEIFPVDTKETDLNVVLSVFPNPTTNELILQIAHFNNKKLFYQLFDSQGKSITSSQITDNQTIIKINDLPAAIYFLTISQNKRQIKSFKIVKN